MRRRVCLRRRRVTDVRACVRVCADGAEPFAVPLSPAGAVGGVDVERLRRQRRQVASALRAAAAPRSLSSADGRRRMCGCSALRRSSASTTCDRCACAPLRCRRRATSVRRALARRRRHALTCRCSAMVRLGRRRRRRLAAGAARSAASAQNAASRLHCSHVRPTLRASRVVAHSSVGRSESTVRRIVTRLCVSRLLLRRPRRVALTASARRGKRTPLRFELPPPLQALLPRAYALASGVLLGAQLQASAATMTVCSSSLTRRACAQHADDVEHERGRLLSSTLRDALPLIEPTLYVVEATVRPSASSALRRLTAVARRRRRRQR